MMVRIALLSLALISVLFAACSEDEVESPPLGPRAEPFLAWTTPSASRTELNQRREALGVALRARGGGIYLAPASDGFSGGETFRQTDDFHYFVGLELPNSLFLLDASGDASLYVPERDQRFESSSRANDFPGRPLLNDEEIARACDLELKPIDTLDATLRDVVKRGVPLFVDLGRSGKLPATDYIFSWTAAEGLAFHLHREHPQLALENAQPIVASLRMIKSTAEIELIRRVALITAEGIAATAKQIRAGVTERGLEGELERSFKQAGAQRLAFDSIIKSGQNSLWPWRILAAHYDRRNRAMHDGELVIFDVGAELDHYASDVGRTFPVSGKFTAEQRRLVEMATHVSDAIIAAIRPGVTFADLRRVAYDAIPDEEEPYMQTGLFFGHHVGLAVGDPSLAEARLQAGMTFTVEPWYYNHEREIAVFIEDEVLVTENGCENLTATLPRSPEALAAMVRAGE